MPIIFKTSRIGLNDMIVIEQQSENKLFGCQF